MYDQLQIVRFSTSHPNLEFGQGDAACYSYVKIENLRRELSETQFRNRDQEQAERVWFVDIAKWKVSQI